MGRVFEVDEDIDSEAVEPLPPAKPRTPFRRTNRLLRWYRQLRCAPMRWKSRLRQVSPFQFENVATHQPWLVPVLELRPIASPSPTLERSANWLTRFGKSSFKAVNRPSAN